MAQDQIIARLASIKVELDNYYTPQPAVEGEEVKTLSARAFDSLISERDRLTRMLV